MQPDEEELAYRRLLMQPNFRLLSGRLRRGDRRPTTSSRPGSTSTSSRRPSGRSIRAEPIVTPLFARLLLRDDVLAALKAQPAADPEIQAACLKLAGTWPESADQCNNAGWALVRDPGRPEADYQRGLRLARAACRLEPENGAFLNTLGVAQYRCGLMAEALATLTRSNDLNKQKEPSDLAFLALAQHRLGQSEQARATLGRLREVMKNPQRPEIRRRRPSSARPRRSSSTGSSRPTRSHADVPRGREGHAAAALWQIPAP